MAEITENLAQIEWNIKEAKKRSQSEQDVHIIAVTKEVDENRTSEALKAGLLHLGENRPEGLLAKKEAIQQPAIWHYIGSLQTRKVKQIIDEIEYLHSLDRMSLAEEIEKRAQHRVKCFVQVNVSGEESKHGLTPEDTMIFLQQLGKMSKIEVVGLMTMAPYSDDKELIRTVFRKLKKLQQEVVALQLPYAPCTELSMGMSNDYEIAVEEGATFIRIGTALVG